MRNANACTCCSSLEPLCRNTSHSFSTVLRKAANANKILAQEFNDKLKIMMSKWDLYARPMFNCSQAYLNAPVREARERAVLDFLANFDWEQGHQQQAGMREAAREFALGA